MTKTDQNIFYKAFGACIKSERICRGITIANLAKESLEQNKTIRHIESGKRCSMHHLVWAERILDITMNVVIEYINNHRELINDEEEKARGIQDLSDYI